MINNYFITSSHAQPNLVDPGEKATAIMSTSQNVKEVKEAIESAGKLVDKYLIADQTFYDLSGLLRVTSDRVTNGSGQSDVDYPALTPSLPSLGGMPFLGEVNHTPLPPELLQEFENMQCNSAMGLMPVIRRAWLTIDSTIYMWNYEDGKDLAYFDGLKEVILAVGLIIPRVGIFQEHIQYLLCLTTPTEIIVLGVSFAASSTDPYCELHLLPEPLFCLPSDNISMISITGTCTGRIFLSGRDGCLYELLYQAEDGWFTRRCRKVNHSVSYLSYLLPSFLSFSEEDPLVQIVEDGSRNILYTRSEKGTIQVYDLGDDGTSLSRVAYITIDTIVHKACTALRTADKTLFNSLVHIALIPPVESATLHLVAITKAGVRLYFTTTPQGVFQRPSLLSLVHARFPPGYCPSNAAMRPGNTVHQAFYRRGYLLLASSQTEDRDSVWLVDPDLFPFQSNLMETFVTYPLNGRTWAMAESIEVGELEAVDSLSPLPPAVVTQHSCPPRQFILLTTNGSYILTKPRPVDQLKSLLEQYKTGQCEPIEEFFRLHGNVQACSMCLILATGPHREIAHWASQAYFYYGGEPHFIFPTTLGPANQQLTSPQISSSPATPFSQVSTPFSPLGGALGRPVIGPEVQLSGKHEGLSLYLSRLLRPLWNILITVEGREHTQPFKYFSRYTSTELAVLGEQLLELRAFLDRNIQFFTSTDLNQSQTSPSNVHQRMLRFMRPDSMQTNSPVHVQQSLLNKYRNDANMIERTSLQNLHHLIVRCCESLSLWKLLCEYQFDVVADKLDETKKMLLKLSSFKVLATGGKELSSALINSLLACHAGDSSITDSLVSRLRQLAPSLFSQEDAVASKAQELVTIATTLENPIDQQSMLRDSLKLYSQVTQQINLISVCEQYRSLRYYEGIVELALCTASQRDPQNLAIHFYKSGQPLGDTSGQQALSERQEAYSVITGTLGQLLQQAQTPSSPAVPIKPGPPPSSASEQRVDPARDFETMLRLSLRSDDEVFHVTLYSWLLSDTVKMADRLIEIQSPYIEDFLKYTVSLQQDNTTILDLLWRFYERNKNYLAAAKILDQLAQRESPELMLDQRLEYISRAVMCAKSSGAVTSVSGEGEFLHELEEKMEVARIQLSILESINNLPSSRHTKSAITMLNAELMDVSKLYGDFAEPFDLPESKLSIVHCAGHFDPILIESLWRDIVEQELQLTLQHDRDTRMDNLRNKLFTLGQIYSRSERYFPLNYLIKLLEQHCCQLGWRAGFVPETFHQLGVSYPMLFTIYNVLFNEKDSFWQSAGHPLHILSVLLALLTTYSQNTSLVSLYERPSFTANISAAIDRYLVDLQTLDQTTPDLVPITTGLRNLKRDIQRV